MILALILLAQDVPATNAAPVTEGEEITVRATYGRTTMLFDRTNDGKLLNCRIMVSSGSQKRDTDACQATPVCYARTADEVTECVELTIEPVRMTVAPSAAAGSAYGGKAPAVFDMPALVKPRPPAPAIGPSDPVTENRDTERQRVKLPPLPKAPTDGPVIRFGNGNGNDDTDPR
jgi:hypothetical protein